MDRFRVIGMQGKGVFSTVLRVVDIKATNANSNSATSMTSAATQSQDQKDSNVDKEEGSLKDSNTTAVGANNIYCIKVVRSQEIMYKAALKECEYLHITSRNDPDNKKHIIHLHSSFDWCGHLCMVFEPMHCNLREVIKNLGGMGLSVQAVKMWTKQLLIGLRHLKQCSILHADIKPDNILVNEQMTSVKLCDLGSGGMLNSPQDITPYLVSRFYRAPEIILGLAYDEHIDMWSLGTVVFELFTGKVMFPGASNNDMLRLYMETFGDMPRKKILKKTAMFYSQHFDDQGNFLQRKHDSLSGVDISQVVVFSNSKPTRDLMRMLRDAAALDVDSNRDRKGQDDVALLYDLLCKMLALDSTRRITVEEALRHPFLHRN
jgi:serine/threonine-protein kinase PRP4